ncbi:MAG: hypothetical protein QM742_13050 [Aquabacterium sp.]
MINTHILSRWFKLLLLLCLTAGIGKAVAGYYVYTTGVYAPPDPGAALYTIDFSTRTLGTENTATPSRLSYTSAAGAAGFLTSAGSVSYSTGGPSASGFSGNAMRLTSGTTSNVTTATVTFANATPYLGMMWRAQFNAENSQTLTLTLSDGSTKVLKNCTASTNNQCIGMYVDDPSWLTSLLNVLFGWLFGDTITWYPIYVQYTPDLGVKVTKAEFKVSNCAGCGSFLSPNTSQDWYIDSLSYIDGSVVPDHLEITTLSPNASSVSANSAVTMRIKACGNAACTTKYMTGVTGTLSVTGVTATYTGAWTIPAGTTNYVDVVVTPTAAGTATFSTTYNPTPSNTPKVFCGMGVAAASGNSCNLTVTVPLHHVRISASNGLTCSPLTYNIEACADATCTTKYNSGLTGTLAVSGAGMTVNYPSGADFSIANGSSSTTVSVHATTVGSLTAATVSNLKNLSAVTVTPTGSPSTYCGMNGTTPASGGSCTVSVASSALLVSVPAHYSNASATATITAVRASDNNASCTPAFASVSKNVLFKCTYSNPATGTLPVRVGGAALNATNSTSAVCDTTGQSVSLSFNASGVATATLQYADVGRMGLSATYTGSGTDAGLSMTGSTTFVAAPYDFAVSGLAVNTVGSPAGCSTSNFMAGCTFKGTITARNASGAATPNFGKETSPEGATLTFTRTMPAGGSGGTFSGTLGSFTSGAASSTNMTWSEVGKGDVVATLTSGSYLSSGLSATGASTGGAAGIFYPHHFTVSASNRCSTFTYSGQPFAVTVTALNATGGTTTNYAGSGTISAAAPVYPNGVTLSETTSAAGSLTNSTIAATSFVSGVATVAASSTSPTFTYTSKLTYRAAALNLRATDAWPASGAASSSGYTEGSVSLRSGRLKVSNGFGSEKATLQIPVQAQYWYCNASNLCAWVLNSADNACTVIPTSAIARGNYVDHKGASTVAWTTTPTAAVTIGTNCSGSPTPGTGCLNLGAPNPSGSVGSVDFAFNLGPPLPRPMPPA